MSSKRTCRYYETAKGCFQGDKCPFLHERGAQNRQKTTSLTQLESPPGSCRYYWTYGSCKLDPCRFRHIEPGDFTSPFGYRPNYSLISSRIRPSISTPKYESVSPSEALNHLEMMRDAKFLMNRPRQIIIFVALLRNAGSKGDSWTSEDAQTFLEKLTSPHGLSRLETILTYPNVTSHVSDAKKDILFQTTYISCLSYLISEFVMDSTLRIRVNTLFGLIHTNYIRIEEIITTCMATIASGKSFADPPNGNGSGYEVFTVIIKILLEYIIRFKSALKDHLSLPSFVQQLRGWFELWATGSFQDEWDANGTSRDVAIDEAKKQLGRLLSIVERESRFIQKLPAGGALARSAEEIQRGQQALIGPLEIYYDPAGHLRPQGPRHDNDFANIGEISIPPTQQEMICTSQPFLPANIPGAPHHLSSESMERLLDIQFRLLREELIASLRSALQLILSDLKAPPKQKTLMGPILSNSGGRYHGQVDRNDSVMVNVYTGVNIVAVVTDRKGISIEIEFDAPPGPARNKSAKKREDYWEALSRKRLMQGGLIGILWEVGSKTELFFGLISSSATDLKASAAKLSETLRLRINFFDASIYTRAIDWLQMEDVRRTRARIFMVEAPVMYQSIFPFLVALQGEPTSIPFAKYLVHRERTHDMQPGAIDPPQYTLRGGFRWDLNCLCAGLEFDVQSPISVKHALLDLREDSCLDESQADAMINCLTQEFCLIQGPPGTGKSFTGVEIMRVLIANRVGQILLIAFTNHALDHLINRVLDAGITKKIVRLGSRSKDERVSKFGLEELERVQADTRNRRSNSAYWEVKEVSKELDLLMHKIKGDRVDERKREIFMELYYGDHLEAILYPPMWVSEAYRWDIEEGFTTVGKKADQYRSLYDYWEEGSDIAFLQGIIRARSDPKFQEPEFSPNLPAEDPYEAQQKYFEQFTPLEVPNGDRPLDELLNTPKPWEMSIAERKKLSKAFNDKSRSHFLNVYKQDFTLLQRRFANAQEAYDECQAQIRLDLLRKVDIIGCTTNGAAKLTSLLKGVKPTVLVVEEAGQILESHILGSLVPSIQHVIMIGDPLQLRPTISNYPLSMDHPRGREIYKFDQSTMERLDQSGLPMSQLRVQRRMRPQVSSIARRTLYPSLRDHPMVEHYPPVRGFAKNMFFFDHTNPEGGTDEESMSKYNPFEVSMIKHLLVHLLRQGTYSTKGSIVVLCMYLGQLAKLRDALRTSKINVILDSRDEEELRNQEKDADGSSDDQVEVSEIRLSDQVLLRTVDNFQGEEADIVLLSLVRNPGPGKSGSIGFLRSINRVNVALTRAKHGLFVLGNATVLAGQNQMWKEVIQEFKDQECFGPGIPIACHRHPEYIQYISTPEMLPRISPDGGCLQPCDFRMRCGHTCLSKCHSDDPDHLVAKCYEPCRKACSKGHSCTRRCWEKCGNCSFPIPQVELDCGHTLSNAACYLEDDKSLIRCMKNVEKKIPGCGHLASLKCHKDPSKHHCQAICGQIMPCCSKPCGSRCGDCKVAASAQGGRSKHAHHVCRRIMHCQHTCNQTCDETHQKDCGTRNCTEACRQSCEHHTCTLGCSTPCTPCAMSCLWKCTHRSCLVPCGSPCTRLPCDERCENTLGCGHTCPSLCGEPCEQQVCPTCAPEEEREKIVDLVMQSSLADLDYESSELENITITLRCGHTWTVETLDGVCDLKDYYEKNSENRWIGPALKDMGVVKTPCCPTCRSPISARRYGRVVKRGNLDLLERNVASSMAIRLSTLRLELRKFDTKKYEATLPLIFRSHPVQIEAEKLEKITEANRRKLQLDPSGKLEPVPVHPFGQGLSRCHAIPTESSRLWIEETRPILDCYSKAWEIARSRSAHVNAFEASVSMLYEQERLRAKTTSIPSETPEADAMRVARIKVGMTPPRTDQRFHVEAIWLTIELRFILGTMAETWISTFDDRGNNKDLWGRFANFIYSSCRRDSIVCAEIARRAWAHRQHLLCLLFKFRSRWRSLRLKVLLDRTKRRDISPERRNELLSINDEELAEAKLEAKKARTEYLSMRGSPDSQLRADFDIPLMALWRKWEETLERLKRPTMFYQTVSDEEMRQVVGSFTEYTHRGHWYYCPNGHPFTIGDCGGANGLGNCNECGETIGGTGHQLVSGITRAATLENISRAQGVLEPVYPWTQGA